MATMKDTDIGCVPCVTPSLSVFLGRERITGICLLMTNNAALCPEQRRAGSYICTWLKPVLPALSVSSEASFGTESTEEDQTNKKCGTPQTGHLQASIFDICIFVLMPLHISSAHARNVSINILLSVAYPAQSCIQ